MSSTPASTTPTSTEKVPGSRAHVMVEIVCSLLPLVTLVVGLRLCTRARVVRSVGLDDCVITLALVFTICTGVVMGVMTTHGLGEHIDNLNAEMLEQYLYDFYFSILFYYISLGLIKLAILLQYYPLVAVRNKIVMIIIIAGICSWSLALVFTSIFNCVPIEGFWKPDIEAKCIPSLPLWYVNAGGNIITDIIIFALPIPIVWKLKMPNAQRLSLIGVFGLGFFTCTISIVRIEFLNLGRDFTYLNIRPAGWSLGEICAGIVCACLPTLRPLLFKMVPGAHRSLPQRIKFSKYVSQPNQDKDKDGRLQRSGASKMSAAQADAHDKDKNNYNNYNNNSSSSSKSRSRDVEGDDHYDDENTLYTTESQTKLTKHAADIETGTMPSDWSLERPQVFRNVM